MELAHPVGQGWFMDVFFLDADTGWVAGEDDTAAVILKTEDGGTTWNPVDISELVVPPQSTLNTKRSSDSSKLVVGGTVEQIILSERVLIVLVNFAVEAIVYLIENAGEGEGSSTESIPGRVNNINQDKDIIRGRKRGKFQK